MSSETSPAPPAADELHKEKHGFLSGLFGGGDKDKGKAEAPQDAPKDGAEQQVFTPPAESGAPTAAVDAINGPPGNHSSPDVIAPGPVEVPPAEDPHESLIKVENTTHDAEAAPVSSDAEATPEAAEEINTELATGVESGTEAEGTGEKPVTIRIGGDTPAETVATDSEPEAEPSSDAPPEIDVTTLDPLAHLEKSEDDEAETKPVESESVSATPDAHVAEVTTPEVTTPEPTAEVEFPAPPVEDAPAVEATPEPTPDLTQPPHTPESVIESSEPEPTPEVPVTAEAGAEVVDWEVIRGKIEAARKSLDDLEADLPKAA